MTDATIDLVAVSDDIDWPDLSASTTIRPIAAQLGGRLGELIEWWAATRSQSLVTQPLRPRCLVVGTVDDAVRTMADDLGVPIDELAVPDDADADRAFALGVAAADDQAESGTDLLVIADPDASAAAALLVSVLTGAEPVSLLPRGAAAIDTASWIAHARHLRDGRRRLANLRTNPSRLLAELDHPRMAATVGLVTRAVARRTSVVLDGTAALAAALLCHDVQGRAARWWQIADASPDPVHTRATLELGQTPLLDLRLRRGDGVAGLLTVPLVNAAVALAGAADAS